MENNVESYDEYLDRLIRLNKSLLDNPSLISDPSAYRLKTLDEVLQFIANFLDQLMERKKENEDFKREWANKKPDMTVTEATRRHIQELYEDGFLTDSSFPLLADISRDLYHDIEYKIISFDYSNLLVVGEDDDLDRLTRLSVLMPKPVTMTFQSSLGNQHRIDYNDRSWEAYLHEPRNGIGDDWLRTIVPLLRSGAINYCPNVAIVGIDGESINENYTVKTNERTLPEQQAIMVPTLRQAFNIEIPYFYDAPLSDFSMTAADNMDSLEDFRIFFSKSILATDLSKAKELLDLELELRAKMRKIETEHKKVLAKLKRGVAMGAIATVIATLFIIHDFNFSHRHHIIN